MSVPVAVRAWASARSGPTAGSTRGDPRFGRRSVRLFGAACWVTISVVSAFALPSSVAGRVGGGALLAAFTGSWIWCFFHRDGAPDWVAASRLLLLAVSGGALTLVAQAGQVYAIVFAICAIAPATLPDRWARVVSIATIVINFPVFVLSGGDGVVGSLLVSCGAAFFFIVSASSVASRTALKQAEETREAQAHAAVLDERGRIAREMHDILAHTLSGLTVQLEGARLLAVRTGAEPDLVRRLAGAHQLAVSGLGEARRAVGTLRDTALPGPEELATLVGCYGPDAHLTVEGTARPVSAAVGVAIYRAAQEGLTNARRHAGAPTVELRICWLAHVVRLEIADSGGPVRPRPSGESGGYGLTGMRERAELAGGWLRAGPSATGWTVELELPA